MSQACALLPVQTAEQNLKQQNRSETVKQSLKQQNRI